MSKNKAFTLIELLVVIAIIGILATLAIISLQQARQNARNAKRVADLRQMQTALALYFNDNNQYPSIDEFQIGEELISSSTGKILMHQIPSAPSVADGSCLTSDYTYTVNEDNSSYKLKTCISKNINSLEAGIVTATPSFMGYLDSCDNQTEFTDARDDNTYQIVAIGDQCWMAENLRYLPEVSPPSLYSIEDPYHYVYDYYGADIEEAKQSIRYINHGTLYNWPAALTACPENWKLPSLGDTNILEQFLSDEGASCVSNRNGLDCFSAGDKMKLSSNNESGFSALLSGRMYLSTSFSGIGSISWFWTSSEAGTLRWTKLLYSNYSTIAQYRYNPSYGHSIRCLR